MMESVKIEASRKIVEETRRLYANILLKSLDEKQLARPPFKFIQDLVKNLIKETKILRDVYKPAELDTSSRKSLDRHAKVEFVQRLIDFVANNKQPVTSCVAARVVAGLEPNKTNELLQALARVALLRRSASGERRPRTFTKPPISGGKQPLNASRKSSQSGEINALNQSPQTQQPAQPTQLVDNKTQATTDEKGKRVQVASELDISKGIQHVRLNLKSICSILAHVNKTENSLRDLLLVHNKQTWPL